LREELGHALDHLVATSEAVDLVDDVQAVDVHVNKRAEAVSGFPKPEALILSGNPQRPRVEVFYGKKPIRLGIA
jgi:hypothetical protein